MRFPHDLLASSSSTDSFAASCDCPGKDSTIFSLLQARSYEFDVERAVYLTVLVLRVGAWKPCTVVESVPELRYGDKSLVGNKGYRRYLKVEGITTERPVVQLCWRKVLEPRGTGCFVESTEGPNSEK